jgi:hypothetical protein
MKNIKTLEHFLLESKNSAMRYLRSGCMDEDTFYDFLDMDKTPTKKFVEKMCQFYCEGEDGGYVFDIFSELMRLKIFDFDINSVETLSDIADIIEDYKLSGKRERVKLDPSLDGGVLVFQNERFDVLYIKDENSSCYYGRGTKWCISANQEGGINMWDDPQYEHLNFYFVFDYQTMDKSLKRLAVGVPNQNDVGTIVWNSRDNQTGTRVNIQYLYDQGIPENIFKYHEEK